MSDKPKKEKYPGLSSKKWHIPKASSGTLQKGKKTLSYRSYNFKLYILWISMSLLLTLFIIPSFSVRVSTIQAGDISSKDIKATMDFSLEDHEITIQRQKEAELSVLPVYDYNDRLQLELVRKLSQLFENLRAFYQKKNPPSPLKDTNLPVSEISSKEEIVSEVDVKHTETNKDWAQEWSKFVQDKGLNFDYNQYLIFEKHNFAKEIENEMIKIIVETMNKGIIPSYSFTFNEPERGIVKRTLNTQTEIKIKDLSNILDVNDAQRLVESKVKAAFPEDKGLANILISILKGYITPNLTLNLSETHKRIELARQAVKPAFFQIKKGEMIIREGERAKADQVEKLNALMRLKKEENVFKTILGLCIITGFILMMLFIFLKRFRPKQAAKFKNLVLIAFCILITMGIMRIFLFIAHGLPSTIPIIPPQSYYFAFPFAAAALIIAILMETEIAIMVAVVMAMLAGILLNRDLSFFIVAFLGSVSGIYFLSYRKNKTNIVKSGLIVGLINLVVIASLNFIQGIFFTVSGVFNLIFGFFGGLTVIAVVLAFVPFLEPLFHLTTDITLLQLLNLNNPLLRSLAMDAPGTYHHCIVVANLAEAACETINTNSLLARVAAYYHDIGKIKMPRYYIENQMNMRNEHENLSPSMSGLILISHVKDGVEMGKKYKLNQHIIDIIREHHGTSLIKYFYMKAKELQTSEGQEVKEEDYRYPGPKPQTKEAGIVMLADAVEATSRTLTDPRPARIQGMIQNTINNIFKDGQLDECELTLKNLHQIAKSFNRILMGIFHPRIIYPGTNGSEEIKKEKSGDSNQKSSKEAKTGQQMDKEGGGEDIKRLGIS